MMPTLQQLADTLTTRLTLPRAWIIPLLAVTLGYRVGYADSPEKPTGWGGRLSLGRSETDSLFYNGVFYCRVMLPFFVSLQIRWAGSDPTRREYLQVYIGWKLNGAPSIVVRIQSDASSAAGTTSANPNQAIGWADGRK